MSLAEILPAAQQLSLRDKLPLVRILIEEIDSEEDISPLELNKSYYIATPYDMYGVASAMKKVTKGLHQEQDDAV